jgi:hypothetical protein
LIFEKVLKVWVNVHRIEIFLTTKIVSLSSHYGLDPGSIRKKLILDPKYPDPDPGVPDPKH